MSPLKQHIWQFRFNQDSKIYMELLLKVYRGIVNKEALQKYFY